MTYKVCPYYTVQPSFIRAYRELYIYPALETLSKIRDTAYSIVIQQYPFQQITNETAIKLKL